MEVFEDYLTPLHSYIYNKIYIGEAADVLPTIDHKYDLLILIDVIEHFTEEKGLEFLEICFARANNVLISTPRVMAPQGDAFDNSHETHLFQWKPEHFSAYANSVRLDRNNDSLIYYIGHDFDKVRLNSRDRFQKDWPFVHHIIRKIKELIG